MKLDMSIPYSYVFGRSGVKYEQNGVDFDSYGNSVTPVDQSKPVPPEKRGQTVKVNLKNAGVPQ